MSHDSSTPQNSVSVPVSRTDSLPAAAEEQPTRRRWVRTPPIDIFETEAGLVLRADLPGVTTETLNLQVQDNRLTLFGQVGPQIPEGAQLLHEEYHVGDFLRSFILSDDVDHERIEAKLTGGVLEVTLPRAPRSQPRKIVVKAD